MKSFKQIESWIKKSKKGFSGYPMATVAFYGPTNMKASKVVIGIILEEDSDPVLHKWLSQEVDIRSNAKIIKEIKRLIKKNQVKTIAMKQIIFGCPHEEGIDYPENESCPECPYWRDRDRETHLLQNDEFNKAKLLAQFGWQNFN